MMQKSYINIMIESLQKKVAVLDEVIKCSEGQKAVLEDANLDPDTFQEDGRKKAIWIEKLEKLDDGFDSLYQKVKEELQDNKEQYKEEIHKMQDLIRQITERSAQIQALEARNKELVEA